jgi:phosphoglycerate kinase
MQKTKLFSKKTLTDVPLEGQAVLVRADYNVPLESNGTIADDYRITQSLPTLEYLLKQKCRIVICAHLGRPDGKPDKKYSLAPVAERLQQLVDASVRFIPRTVGDAVRVATHRMEPGSIVLLENLRFNPEEEANDERFAEQLAIDSNTDYFVQDGFGVVHRAHASTSAITHYLPSVAGKLLEREVTAIVSAVHHPKRPLVAILGGAKISDKIKVVEHFVEMADQIIIGGAMANTFLKFKGYPIGKSKSEDGLDDVMKRIYEVAEKKLGDSRSVDDFILLPVDVAVAHSIEDDSERRATVAVGDVAEDEYILDVGSESVFVAAQKLQGAKTVVWNGTMGLAEKPKYAYGSSLIAEILAMQKDQTETIVGGGDTADFVLHWDERKGGSFEHVSTGGGASLELMAGDPMPGIDSLLDA